MISVTSSLLAPLGSCWKLLPPAPNHHREQRRENANDSGIVSLAGTERESAGD